MNGNERYVFVLPIRRVEERTAQRYVTGVGKEAKFVTYSVGWYVTAGHLSFGLGPTRPALAPGDILRITLEKETTP